MKLQKRFIERPLATILVVGLALLATAPVLAAGPPPKVAPAPGPGWNIPDADPNTLDPRATAMLKGMADYVRGLKAFSFKAESTFDIVADTGQKLQYIGQTEILVRGTDRLWLRRTAAVAQVEGYYDGKTATIWDKTQNYYATRPAPPTVDGLLDMIQDELGMDVPAADLLYSDLYAGLMRHTVSGFYVGLGVVGGVRAHQLAFRGKEVDWQIWIEDGARPVPLKYVITRKWYTGAPEQSVELANWNVAPQATDDTFAFKPPAGAVKAPFWSPASMPTVFK
jgi:hypothetical protein